MTLARSPTTQASALIDRLRGASPSEVMEVRLLIEPVAAELAATRATMEDLRRIADCLREAERAPDLLGFEHWDGMLHLAIVAAARNGLLKTICACHKRSAQSAGMDAFETTERHARAPLDISPPAFGYPRGTERPRYR